MAEIKLVFKPDYSEVNKAIQNIRQDIAKSLGNIKISIDSGGIQATQTLASNLQKASSAAMEYDRRLDDVRKAAQALQGEFGKLQRIVGTTFSEETEQFTQAVAEFGKAGEEVRRVAIAFDEAGEATHTLVSGTEDVAAASKRAAKEAAQAAKEKEKSDRQIAQTAKELDREMEKSRKERNAQFQKFEQEQREYEAKQHKKRVEEIQFEAEEQRKQKQAELEVERQIAAEIEAVHEEQRKRMAAFQQEQAQWTAQNDAEQHRKNAEAIQFEAEEQRKLREEQERANKEREKAAETAVTLERQYSNLIRQIQNLKAQYPEGTFDDIEQQAREARDELRNLDKTTEDYANRVKNSSGIYQRLQRDLANTRQETSKLDKVTESFWMNIQKFARWYIGGNIVTKVIGSLREALSTMKEVDTELANIQKVTDRTTAQMKATAEAAYDVASAYGVAAQDYLESVGEFAKAGFGDMSEQLAEIATKTQLVGDVTSSIANKFLIASNAAWEMGGNVDRLNQMLDAANVIENNYATSIEKLAQGMPIAASIAAQAGMTFEQTIAALGTITSVTQETGTKAATALRALILNIIGAVGEYEDGIEVTEESVKSLDGILQVYAKDALAAADAAGTVINPMEAIAALAKASEEGLVNQAELFDVLSSLGGKLRTNQLTALVQNYDMFLEMLDKTTQSAGSADREIGVMLDTWEAKTNILKNTWTEFVSHLIDTGVIKDALDTITKLIDFLDTKTGTVTIKLAALSYVFVGLGKGIHNTLKDAKDLGSLLEKILPSLKGLAGTTAGAIAGIAAIAAGTTVATVAMYNNLTVTEEEYKQATEDATNAYELAKSEYDELVSKSGSLTEAEQNRLSILKEQLETLRKQKGTSTYQQYMSQYDPTDPNKNAASVATQLQRDYNYQLQMARDPNNGLQRNIWIKNAEETKQKVREMADALREYSELLGQDLPESGKYALVTLDNMIKAWDEEEEAARKAAEETNKAAEAENEVGEQGQNAAPKVKTLAERLAEASDAATAYDTAISEVKTALDEFGAGSIEVYNAMVKLEAAIPGSTNQLYDFSTATWKIDASLIESKADLLDFIDTQKQLEFSNAISQLEDMAAAYWDVAGAALAAMTNQQAQAQMAGVLAFTGTDASMAQSGISSQLAGLKSQKAEWDAYVATLRARSSYQPDSGGSGRSGYTPVSSAPESTKDPELERLKAIVSLEKAELSFLQASGKSLDEINAKRKVIQAALHDEAEYLRGQLEILKAEEVAEEDKAEHEAKIKALEEEILGLSTEWWNIQKNINDDLAKAEEERLKKLEEEKKLLEEQKKLQQEMFDTLKKQVDEYYDKLVADKEKELTLEERILAVQQAEAALANAQKERTVRYYNAATGQWEWQANAKNVKSAQDALKKAQDDLNKYQREQAWKEFKSAWEYVTEQIKAGAMTFKEAYDYMYDAMTRIQDTYGVDLGYVLEDSIGGFKDLNYGIDGLTQEVANSLGASVGVLDEKLKQYETAVGAFKDAFDEASEKIKNGEWTMEDAYSYLRDRAKEIADKYGIDMTGALEEAIAGMDKTNMSIDELWKAVIINLMKVNSARWFDASDEEKKMLHAQNEYLGRLIGATYDPSGYWYLNGSQLYGSQKGVDYSGKTTGYGNFTGSGGGYGISSGGGGGGSGGGSGGSTGGIGSRKDANGNWVYYDSYGNTYATLEEAIAGNAANAQMRNASRGKVYYGSLITSNPAMQENRWTDPGAWAAYSKLTEADPEYAAMLSEIEAAAAGGASQEELTAMKNALYSEFGKGYFGAYQGESGTTGFVKAGYGNANGEHLLILNGKLYETGVDAGTMLQDLWGNRWEVGADGHTLTPMDRAWEAMTDLDNNDLTMAGANAMSDTTAPAPAPMAAKSVTNNRGDTYNLGGISIGEQAAKTTTVFELARMAGQLGQYKGAV